MGVPVLSKLFVSSNQVCNTAKAPGWKRDLNSIFKDTTTGPMTQRKWNIIFTMVKYGDTFYGRLTALIPAAV